MVYSTESDYPFLSGSYTSAQLLNWQQNATKLINLYVNENESTNIATNTITAKMVEIQLVTNAYLQLIQFRGALNQKQDNQLNMEIPPQMELTSTMKQQLQEAYFEEMVVPEQYTIVAKMWANSNEEMEEMH